MKGGIFLTVKDLMLLLGITKYENARKKHKQIRDALSTGTRSKRLLTIKEYCDYELVSISEIWRVIRPNSRNPFLGDE